MCEHFCSHSLSVSARSPWRVSSAWQLPEQSLWLLTPTCKVGNWSCSSCNNGTPRGGSRDGFSGLRVLWKKSSNHTQGAGALLLLKQLSLPSEKHGEGYMCIRAFKISLCVRKYIYRLWMFYLHPLKPEHVITKQYKFSFGGTDIAQASLSPSLFFHP